MVHVSRGNRGVLQCMVYHIAHMSFSVASPREIQPAIQKEFAAISPEVSTHLYRTLRS